MKNKLILLFAVVTLLSCSKDKEQTKDPIIGFWKPIVLKDNGVDITDDCNIKSTADFHENGKAYIEVFEKVQNGCTPNPKREASWRKKNGDVYEFNPTDGEPEEVPFLIIYVMS